MATSKVVEYCTEEVARQGHDVTRLDGLERVGWMLHAWTFALANATRASGISVPLLYNLGRMVEPQKNMFGWRRCNMAVSGSADTFPPPEQVHDRIFTLVERQAAYAPLELYRELLKVHPFEDGNGRAGKVVLNLAAGTLLDPFFPPADFWGEAIVNP